MNTYKLETIRVDLDEIGLPGAYVLITNNPKQSKKYRDFLLAHDNIGIVVFMFGCEVENEINAKKLAIFNAPDYAPEIFEAE